MLHLVNMLADTCLKDKRKDERKKKDRKAEEASKGGTVNSSISKPFC